MLQVTAQVILWAILLGCILGMLVFGLTGRTLKDPKNRKGK